MSLGSSSSSEGSGAGVLSSDEMLRRILSAVEKDRRRGRLELAIAIILSLATLASTWCGYQARQWGSVQASNQASADTAERKAAEDTIVGLQTRTFDALLVQEYWHSLRQNDPATRDSVFAHMRPVLQKAVEAAIAGGALRDPKVPGPFQRPEYVLPEEQNALKLRKEASDFQSVSKAAGDTCGSYVLLTLMFASVLFFGGITGTFTAKRVRMGLSGVSLLLFIITLLLLLDLPVCKA